MSEKNDNNWHLPIGLAIGLGIGTAIGAATGDYGVWMALGSAFGLVLGMAMISGDAEDHPVGGKDEDSDTFDKTSEETDRE